jgi:hypothetical protein
MGTDASRPNLGVDVDTSNPNHKLGLDASLPKSKAGVDNLGHPAMPIPKLGLDTFSPNPEFQTQLECGRELVHPQLGCGRGLAHPQL